MAKHKLYSLFRGTRILRKGWDPMLQPMTVVLANGSTVQFNSPLTFSTPLRLSQDPTVHPAWQGQQEYDVTKVTRAARFLKRFGGVGVGEVALPEQLAAKPAGDKGGLKSKKRRG